MKNNKGFTVFELLVGFIFLIMISHFLLTTMFSIRDKQQLTVMKNQLIDIKNDLTQEIESDLLKHTFMELANCGTNCYELRYATGLIKELLIDPTDNIIKYGDSTYTLIEDSYIKTPFDVAINIINDTITNRGNSILKINIPIEHKEVKGTFGININQPYDVHQKPTPIVMTLVGNETIIIMKDGTYKEAGATAISPNDGNITNKITITDNIDTSKIGTYSVVYEVVDSLGSRGTITRTVKVIIPLVPAEFAYTGTVQSYTVLCTGKYKLEVWGAQGGTYSSYTGGKGGYSVGEINLTEGTILYVFVGGKGTNYSSGYINGGWNGGGGAYGYTSWCDEYNCDSSYKAAGGGGTDISLVTSAVTYSSYRTTRSDASLLARIIVAGGGSGGGSGGSGSAGGGTDGIGYASGWYGTQSSAGTNGLFGYGANGFTSNYCYSSPAGGGGWYGGGGGRNSDSSYSYTYYKGGGSGYVLTSTSHKPTNYTPTSAYWMTNTNMIAGNASMPSPTGGTQTGQSDNGYAKITPLIEY